MRTRCANSSGFTSGAGFSLDACRADRQYKIQNNTAISRIGCYCGLTARSNIAYCHLWRCTCRPLGPSCTLYSLSAWVALFSLHTLRPLGAHWHHEIQGNAAISRIG